MANANLTRLKSMGYRITPQRQEIIRFLSAGADHYSAEEIYSKLKRRFPGISLDTVYRNLNTLKDLGIITTLNFEDGRCRYEISGDPHHHHLVCIRCGVSESISFCPLEYLDAALLKEKDFEPARHSFKIFGYCARCRQAQ